MPNGATSVVGKVTEKLGRWLAHHSSRSDLSVSLNLGVQGGRCHGGLNSSSVMFASRQTSACDDFGFCGSSAAFSDVSAARLSTAVSPTTAQHPGSGSSTAVPTTKMLHLPPLAELFSPQSMFIADVGCETPQPASGPSSPSVTDVGGDAPPLVVDRRAGPSTSNDASRNATRVGGRRADDQSAARLSMNPEGRVATSAAVNCNKTFTVERATADDLNGSALHCDAAAGPRGCPGDFDRGSATGRWSRNDEADTKEPQVGPSSSSGGGGCSSNDCLERHHDETSLLQDDISASRVPLPTIDVTDSMGKVNETADVAVASPFVHDRPKSEASCSSRGSSVSADLYERPESNQCTVTSLTPLLHGAADDDDDDDMDDAAANGSRQSTKPV